MTWGSSGERSFTMMFGMGAAMLAFWVFTGVIVLGLLLLGAFILQRRH
ncbi:MAG: hypothetical protein JWP61_2267 [Friedmanniella sp.]|nr:hypothetical protein [Friedmanniella sp.]